jgi:hypothetical protein
MSGTAVPEHILRALAPTAALDARSNYDPWVRNDNDEHTARHAVIAQTVLERCGEYTALSECFESWVELIRRQPQVLSMFFDVAVGIGYMRPLSTGDKRVPARIRGRFADVLMADSGLLNRLLAEGGANAARLFSWGNLLRSLFPRTPSERYINLYELVMDILTPAFEIAQGTDRSLAERIEYALDCTIRDYALAANEEETIEEREDRIIRWRDFVTRPWAGPRFYADLFDAARDLAHDLTFGSIP